VSRRPALGLALGLALLGAACGRGTIECPLEAVGARVVGRVTTGGLEVSGRITATPVDRSGRIETEPAADGTYQLDLPAGDYYFELRVDGIGETYVYSDGGPRSGFQLRDTVSVREGAAPLVLDWPLGGVRIDVGVPVRYEGQDVRLNLRRVRDDTPDAVIAVVTEVEGGRLRLDLPGVRPGLVMFEAGFGQGFSGYEAEQHVWWPGVADSTDSPPFPVAVDSLTSIRGDLDLSPTRIHGILGGAWRGLGLVSGPTLAFFAADSTLIQDRIYVFPDGAYSLDLLLPRPFKVLASYGSADVWFGGDGFETATLFTPPSGGEMTLPTVSPGALRFDLGLDAPDPGGVQVEVHRAADGALLGEAFMVAAHPYRILPLIAPGEYLLRLRPDTWGWGTTTWRPQWYDRAVDMDEALLVAVPASGDLVTLDLTLEAGGEMSGVVVLSEDEPFVHGRILVTAADDSAALYGRNIWNGLSAFTISGLPDGDYRLGCIWSLTYDVEAEEDTLWYPAVRDWDQAQVLEIREAGVLAGLDFDLR